MTNPSPSLSLENIIHWFLLSSFQEVTIGNSIRLEDPHDSSQAGGMEGA